MLSVAHNPITPTPSTLRSSRRSRPLRAATLSQASASARGSLTPTKASTVATEADATPVCLSPPAATSVLGIILGGGAGSRLYPLTKKRAKPAVPLCANYRLIDIPVSNCINSEVRRVYCLTQFNSASLNRHLSRAYNMGGATRSDGFVEVLAAQQSPNDEKWFEGTADAVRQYLWLFEEAKCEEYLILAGDHLYRMDYGPFVAAHRAADADITIACLPMDGERAADFGLMKIDDTGRVTDFSEKPEGAALEAMAVDTTILGLDKERAAESPYIASMGIYVFKREALLELLKAEGAGKDFGSEIIPGAQKDGKKVQAYLYDGYWEDIGTIKAFYEANLALTDADPKFSFFDRAAPIYTQSRYLPPSKIMDATISQSVIGDGCLVLDGAEVAHSVVGLRSIINKKASVKDTLLMGADFYETDQEVAKILLDQKNGNRMAVPIGIGKGAEVRGCIIDKNARIGENVKIINKENIQEAECEADGYWIKSGIVTVIKDTTIPAGTVI